MGEPVMLTMETVITLAFAIIAILLAVIGHFLRGLHKDFRDVEKALPVEYVRRDDWHRSIDEVKSMLQQIFNKLDNKADK